MPRRKVLTIDVSQLKRCTDVYLALKNDPIFEEYDLSTLTISVKAKITPVIKNAERAASNLENFLVANPACYEEFNDVKYVTKQKLAKMMRVSRTTLDKWFNDGLIIPIYVGGSALIEVCDPYDILAQLKKKK